MNGKVPPTLDHVKMFEKIKDTAVAMEARVRLATDALDKHPHFLDTETEVACRLLRASPNDFKNLIIPDEASSGWLYPDFYIRGSSCPGISGFRKDSYDRPVLNDLLSMENNAEMLVRACDVLAFRGGRSSAAPLARLTINAQAADVANAALGALSVLAFIYSFNNEMVFIGQLERIRAAAGQSLSPQSTVHTLIAYLKKLRDGVEDAGAERRKLLDEESMFSKRIHALKRRMRERRVPGFMALPEKIPNTLRRNKGPNTRPQNRENPKKMRVREPKLR